MGSLRDMRRSEEEAEFDYSLSGILDEIRGSQIAREKGLDHLIDLAVQLMEGTRGIEHLYDPTPEKKNDKPS